MSQLLYYISIAKQLSMCQDSFLQANANATAGKYSPAINWGYLTSTFTSIVIEVLEMPTSSWLCENLTDTREGHLRINSHH